MGILDLFNGAKSHINKGIELLRQGRNEEAIKEFDTAIELDHSDASAYLNKGFALNRLGKYEDAIKAYDAAIEADPRYAMAYCNKGAVVASVTRKIDKGSGILQKMVQFGSNAYTINITGKSVPTQTLIEFLVVLELLLSKGQGSSPGLINGPASFFGSFSVPGGGEE